MLAGKRVLITGSTRGIGRATAEVMLGQGAEVVLHGRSRQAVAAVMVKLRASFPGVSAVNGDLADRAVIAAIAAAVGEVDVLVHNAGIYRKVGIESVTHADWERMVAVNLTAPWLLTQALLGGLRRRRGTVLLLGSDSAMLGFAGGSPYCATKGGVVGLTRALAIELAPDVRVLCICPGPVETDMMADSLAADPDPAAARAHWVGYTPMQRVAQPAEVASLLAFAASDAAPFATGAVWAIDGGVTAGRLG